ncbi:jg3666 [Pararge aegeria aegeria]|uniref:Jg3666 protein n=1 Tax=Pararge aegeria aegeria TaxID=348720 RepID=A0A8S4S8B2_9NEOP|nr:jg3666 [Pararge aegeria aegeria]
MPKCAKCNKVITKKSPGLQCGRCNKWMHGECVALSHDQLTALHSTEADWKCRGCVGSSKQKRMSVILPDPEEEDITDTDSITAGVSLDSNSQKILATVLSTIRHEIRDSIQEELKRTLKFYSDKIDDFQIKIDNYEEKIKTIENQYTLANLPSPP